MHKFIRLTVSTITDTAIVDCIINTDTIDTVCETEGKVLLVQKDGTRMIIHQSLEHIWEMLK